MTSWGLKEMPATEKVYSFSVMILNLSQETGDMKYLPSRGSVSHLWHWGSELSRVSSSHNLFKFASSWQPGRLRNCHPWTTRWNRLLEAVVNRSGSQCYFVIPAAILTFTFYVENKPQLCSQCWFPGCGHLAQCLCPIFDPLFRRKGYCQLK
jgi:hypothetical protein